MKEPIQLPETTLLVDAAECIRKDPMMVGLAAVASVRRLHIRFLWVDVVHPVSIPVEPNPEKTTLGEWVSIGMPFRPMLAIDDGRGGGGGDDDDPIEPMPDAPKIKEDA